MIYRANFRFRLSDLFRHVLAGDQTSVRYKSVLNNSSPVTMVGTRYFTPSSSTSNISVALGGMAPPAPRAP